MQELHVAYVVTKLELGGAQKVCLALFNGLNNQSHKSWLLTGTQGPLVHLVKDNQSVIWLEDLVREVSWRTLAHEVKTFLNLIKQLGILKRQYPDLIVHTHSTKAGLLGRWAALFAGVKQRVHTIHGYGFNNFQSKPVWLLIYTLELVTSLITTHFICVAQCDADTGKKLFPRFGKKYTLIHAATDTQQFVPAHKTTLETTDHFVFGTVACFKKQKNLFDLLHAFKSVHQHHPTARLEIIGDGILRPAIEVWIEQQRLANAITLHGWQDDVAAISNTWHAFVLTSLWEGLPCAVVEARLLKLPVVSYKTGGIPEIIEHEVNGLLYEQKDWQGIARGMQKLIEHPQLYATLRNHKDNLQTFTYPAMVSAHEACYRSINLTRAKRLVE